MNQQPPGRSGLLAICLALAVLCSICACTPAAKRGITIISQSILDSIPSGSGITITGDSAYIIGDDATSIFALDLNTHHHRKIPIPHSNPAIYREPKPVKHDFESATLIDWDGRTYLLALGSGSKTPTRDSLLLLNTSDYTDCSVLSLQPCYAYLRRETKTSATQWNIEGATMIGSHLLLANRGNNSLIFLEAKALLAWLHNPAMPFPAIETRMLSLPTIQGKPARLSGLCTRSSDEVLFCASVEDTPDWVTDGPILGSFIGSYSISQKAVTTIHLLYDKQGAPLLEKIESLDLHNNTDLVAIADNDDGSSKIFHLQLPQAR